MSPKARISEATLTESTRVLFDAKIDKTGGAEACWMWTASSGTMALGFEYGQMKIGGRRGTTLRAHRIAYIFAKGPIPDGMVVMHSCDRPGCCNPAHLSLGTQRDNVRNCADKGRSGLWIGNEQEAARECKECGAECIHSRCNDCAKARRDGLRAKSLAERGFAPAKMTCGKCGRAGHRHTNCVWEPSIVRAA